MGRIRTFKPELLAHEHLNELEEKHALLRPTLTFLGLFTVSDKKGRFEWKPRNLKLSILPFVDSHTMAEALDLLEDNDFIRRYEVGGKTYGFIPTWHLHQRITGTEATMPARYPDPVGNTLESQSVSTGNIEDTKKDGTPKQKAGRKARSDKKQGEDAAGYKLPADLDPWFDAIWWDLYPEKVVCEGELVSVDRGRKTVARKRFAAWAKKVKPVALYIAFRAYIKSDKKVKDGYIQELSTFLGPKKATVEDYLETTRPYLDKYPALMALTAPPESEEAFQALLVPAVDLEGSHG